MKQVFISFILIAFTNLISGCYTFNSVTISEYKQIEEEKGKPSEIYVNTKAEQWYHFTHTNFIIENDTLFGTGKLLKSENGKTLKVSIALADIESMGVESKNWLLTTFIYFTIIGGIIVSIVAMWWLFTPK